MDEKRRSKRKSMDDGFWDCSVCTYRNTPEAFKCDMCDVRKGTSTRKPRLNPQLVAQQVAQQFLPPPVAAKKERVSHRRERDETGEDGLGGGHRRDRDDDDYEDDRSSEAPNASHVGTLPPNDSSVDSTESARTLPPTDLPEPEAKPAITEHPKQSTTTPSSQPKKEKKSSSTGSQPKKRIPKLRNIDRSSGRSMEVTVGELTVVITDYKPKKPSHSSTADKNNAATPSGHQKDGVDRSGTSPSPANTGSASKPSTPGAPPHTNTTMSDTTPHKTQPSVELDNKNR